MNRGVDVEKIQHTTKAVNDAATKYDSAKKAYEEAKAKYEKLQSEKTQAEQALKTTLLDAIRQAVTSGILVQEDLDDMKDR